MSDPVERDPAAKDDVAEIRAALVKAFAGQPGDDLPPALVDLVDRLRKALASQT